MARSRALSAFATAQALLVVALVAATFERDAVEVELGDGFETRGGLGFDSPFQGLSARCPAVLDEWWVIVSVVGLVVAIGYLVQRRHSAPIASTVATAAIAVALLTLCPIPIPHLGVYLPAIPLTRGQIVVVVLSTGILLHLIAGGYVWYRMRGEVGRTGDESGDRPEEPELSRIADAAGTVADRIESPNATDNQVFEAWREMTALLDVSDPETTTPAEFGRRPLTPG